MRIKTDVELQIDAIETELESALIRVVQTVALSRNPDEVAWWLCANHARFVIDHPNLSAEKTLIDMAERAGTPPKGRTWSEWFQRARDIKRTKLAAAE